MKRLLPLTIVLLLVALTVMLGANPQWRSAAKEQSRWVVVASNVYHDLLRRTGLRSDQIDKSAEVQPLDQIPGYLERIDRTFSSTMAHLGLPPGALEGKQVLEIGPGDNLGVALRFVGAGARRVVVLDKFVPLQTSEFHRALYQEMRNRAGADERQRLDAAIDLSRGVEPRPDMLLYSYGLGIEEVDQVVPEQSIDLIVSNAVLEEVYAIDEAFAGMDRVLRPGGHHVHAIDLRDYGMFSRHGYHPLEFLTIPDSIYRFMVESTGQPNRRLVNYYRDKAAELGYQATIYTTWILGSDEPLSPPRLTLRPGVDYSDALLADARAFRPNLLERYRNLPDEDLLIQGIILVARKPTPGETTDNGR